VSGSSNRPQNVYKTLDVLVPVTGTEQVVKVLSPPAALPGRKWPGRISSLGTCKAALGFASFSATPRDLSKTAAVFPNRINRTALLVE
jgi:hypothetical protein